jgi:hypothetical protein
VQQALATTLGLPGLPLDARGRCALQLTQGHVLQLRFVPAQELLLVAVSVGRTSACPDDALLASMLMSNLFFAEQGEPCFALDAAQGLVLLCRRLSLAGRPVEAVLQDIGMHVDAARRLRETLGEQLLAL